MSFSLQHAIAEAKPGGVVTVPGGTYAVNLLIDKPLSLVGLGEVVLDGQCSGSVVRVNTYGTVKLGGLMIVGGRTNAMGGGVCLEGGELELAQCTLRFDEAPVHGGGGLGIRAGHAKDLLGRPRSSGTWGRSPLADFSPSPPRRRGSGRGLTLSATRTAWSPGSDRSWSTRSWGSPEW